ncbi:Pol polyprotein [Plakobranchus ocellatus]|uniref:Pol polyprotein n=1 Tax=Plakobranchus ocellatus TaxID=259542 RepID=A0AAV3ZFN0_9GAST|nr:Pol polyprotein [Plakobranchus ocellatus]
MDKILQLSVPMKKKEVRNLFGLVNYYRHFIANFVSISAPLSDLLRKGTPEKVQWTPRCDQSLAEIKRPFSSPPILVIPDMQETFVVRSDASYFGIGAVLLQDRDGNLMPCRYVLILTEHSWVFSVAGMWLCFTSLIWCVCVVIGWLGHVTTASFGRSYTLARSLEQWSILVLFFVLNSRGQSWLQVVADLSDCRRYSLNFYTTLCIWAHTIFYPIEAAIEFVLYFA